MAAKLLPQKEPSAQRQQDDPPKRPPDNTPISGSEPNPGEDKYHEKQLMMLDDDGNPLG